MTEKKYILSLDSGSTGIRAILFGKAGEIIKRAYEKTPATYPEPGAIEHDPNMLWNAAKSVINKIIQDNISAEEISAIGICNQRGSFCLWEKETGKPIINFINWADVRAADTCEKMNKNSKLRMIKGIAGIVAKITRSTILTATNKITFSTDFALVRLKWLFEQKPEILERCKNGEILFGTLDTWFIYNLTKGKTHATDFTNAGATGLFNPFDMKWNDIYLDIFKIPMNMLPEAKDSNGDFGVVDKSFFGCEIPIHAAAGDQQAALFGHCAFNTGDVKISQGSGAFVDMNVGPKPKLSRRGLFPLIAWVIDGVPTYMLESYVATAGTLIDWLGQGIGLSDTPKVLNELASQTDDTEGVIFVPAQSGIRFPYFKPNARGSILGLSLSTHRRHVARAVLEGLALRLYDIIEGIERDTKTTIGDIKVDGGVSKSDIELQILANYSNRTVWRAPEADMTATGAAYLAGMGVGFWKDKEELKSLQKGYDKFKPSMDPEKRKKKLKKWKKAIKAILRID
ncbi:MAG: glycerol kinase [Candidatus Lokiarchaeota archaeon]|nr:glycerol kinase [Candidatus Lokiarchaeota archaeon]